ncbi:ABC transporter ATP-binding protein [Sphingobium chungangianum]
MTPSDRAPLLSIEGYSLTIASRRGLVRALDRVSLSIPHGQTVGLVGESGSGKSMLARSILRLLPTTGSVETRGAIRFDGSDLVALPEPEMRKMRGRRISMIFQDPMSSLNPVMKIGEQIAESMRLHLSVSRSDAKTKAAALLTSLGIADAAQMLSRYPSSLSGGMRQRVAIAIALACEPELLIADEPTTALDVTVQAQILDLLRAEQARRGMSILLITHDLGVIARYADTVAILYAGRLLERIPDPRMLRLSRMPYTAALVRSQPDMNAPSHSRLATIDGLPPRLVDLPPGCRFAQRCDQASERCHSDEPGFTEAGGGHGFACWNPIKHEGAAHD